ncbi:MAG TPA: hypothetical protein VK939_02820 [Longimicrobiales bacterium]|nr:hypothetical protein [Longimicrobiales bacterium]
MRITSSPPPARNGIVPLVAALLVLGCADGPAGPEGGPRALLPQPLINGVDDFDRSAVGAIMIYQPSHPSSPGWRSTCTATLIHKRVLVTAGHCIQGIQAGLQSGVYHAAWISFQQDPQEHFNADPAVADPSSAGWYAIESLHDNPANPDFGDIGHYLEIHPDFHDSGAITLAEQVKGIKPMKLPTRPGEVEALLGRADCIDGVDCGLVALGYGLREFPPQSPVLQARQSAPLRYMDVDARWVWTYQLVTPDSEYGAICFGDSGGPVVLQKENGRDRTIVAIAAEVEDPLRFVTCASDLAALNYRMDTEEHLDFMKQVIRASLSQKQ